MEGTLNTKFLGLQTHKKWNLKKHIEEIIKLSGACYAVKAMFLIINTNSLKSIYFACFFSVTKCGMIFWTICPAEERYLLSKRKLLVLWLVQNLQLHVEVLWKKLEILLTNTYVSLIQYLSIGGWIWNKPMSIADEHSHARADTTKHINIICAMSIHVFINKFHCK